MGDDKRKYKIQINDKAFKYYKANTNINIPYRIYHFIPDLIKLTDIFSLSDEIETWASKNGDAEFNIPEDLTDNVFYKENNSKSISSVDCEMHIIKETVQETKVFMISGKEPVISIDMGYVTLVSPFNEELTLHGILNINKCDDISFNFLRELKMKEDLMLKKKTKRENLLKIKKIRLMK